MNDDGRRTDELSPQQQRELLKQLLRKQVGKPRTAPASFAQQRLWFLDQFEESNPSYNIPCHVRLRGPLDVAALERSLNEIVRRHEALRTTFQAVGGEPVQLVAPELTLRLPLVDLAEAPEGTREAEVGRLIAGQTGKRFDLSTGPLLRGRLLRLDERDHVLVLTMHHIVSDGWSMGVLVRELAAHYEAFRRGQPSPLPPLPIQYADYAVWQRKWLSGERMAKLLDYWRRRLEGLPALEMPADRPRPPVQRFCGASRPVRIPKPVSDRLEALSRREGVTPFITLLAAFVGLLHRYTGQDDIVVGSPVANRNRAEIEGLIGFFVNMLVIRCPVEGDPRFGDLLRGVRDVVLEAHTHQELPFEQLVEQLQPPRDESRNPLFQVSFTVQNAPMRSSQLEELYIGQPTFPGFDVSEFKVGASTTRFDLEVHLWERPSGLSGTWIFNTDLFDGRTIERMIGHYLVLLEAIASDADQRLSRLPLLTAGEQEQLLVQWNRTATEYPREATVGELFERQVRQSPEAVAVVFGDQRLTYGELNARANQLAHHLRKRRVGPGTTVAVCLERSPDLVVGLLGILKAGGAYAPLDPEYPKPRLAFMLEDTKTPALLTQQRLAGSLPDYGGEVICLDTDWPGIARQSSHNPDVEGTAESPAYVMYTSGSTGVPKGVCVPHRAIARLVCNTDYVQWEPSDRVAQASNSSFDAATFEIWGPLLNGASLAVIPREVTLSPREFAEVLRRRGITTLFLTTALFNQLAREAPGAFSELRHLLFGGEAVDPASVRSVLEGGPPQRLLHVYGPTESTTFATWYLVEEVAPDAVTVPIGRPIANTELYVLDPHGNPVPAGVPGELYLGGDGLAREYLNRPELTAEKFVPHPFHAPAGARLYRTGDIVRYRVDGNVEFLGRRDGQVKIRGFRIELGEIEAAIREHPAVSDAAVLAREDKPGDKRLAAYVVFADRRQHDRAELRTWLEERLPSYLVPSVLVIMEALPLNPNGKVDRDALPLPGRQVEETYVAPRGDVERQLAQIWQETLKVDEVGVRDSFFELGGHSLLAMQLASRVGEVFGVRISLRNLFKTPTIEQLAQHIEAVRWAAASNQDGPDADGQQRVEIQI